MISAEDIRSLSENISRQTQGLSRLTNPNYVRIDMDVNPVREVAGRLLTVPGGPTSIELAAALETMSRYEKTAVLGIVSYPCCADPGKKALPAAPVSESRRQRKNEP